MPLEHILEELEKLKKLNKDLLTELLSECDEILKTLEIYKPESSFETSVLPKGVVGRRLSDKVSYFESCVKEINNLLINDTTNKQIIQNVEKSLNILIEQLQKFSHVYKNTPQINIPTSLEKIKNNFIILFSIENNFINEYLEFCVNVLKQKMQRATSNLQKEEIKQTYKVYMDLGKNMPFSTISNLKSLNDEYQDVLSPGFIAGEFEATKKKSIMLTEEYEKTLSESEYVKQAVTPLTTLQKLEAKTKAYNSEIEKHQAKFDTLDDDSKHEIEDLIKSYKDAVGIIHDEISKHKQLLMKDYGFDDVETYQDKIKKLQTKIANFEIENNKYIKRTTLLESVLLDIHKLRQNNNNKNKN
jgi:hypothetical protein